MLEIRDLHRSFGETRALQGANLTVTGGEIHALAGENGSGKSTLIKILSGVLRPEAGDVQLGRRAPDRRRPRRRPAGRHRHGLPGDLRRARALGAREHLHRHRRALPLRSPPGRRGARGACRADRHRRRRHRRRAAGLDALAGAAPARHHRARHRPAVAAARAGRGHLRPGREPPRAPLRVPPRGARRRSLRALHVAPHGRARAARRPGDGAAARDDRGRGADGRDVAARDPRADGRQARRRARAGDAGGERLGAAAAPRAGRGRGRGRRRAAARRRRSRSR